MKLLAVSVFILPALLLATALPLSYSTQQPLAPSRRPSPALSFNSADSSTPKSKLTTLLRASTNALTSLAPSTTSPFRCHSKPTDTHILTELFAYIEAVLKRYEDRLFKKGDDADRITFETCLAGYAEDEVAPAIYFGAMRKERLRKVEGLLRSQEVKRGFPDMELVSQGGVLAVVMRGGKGERGGVRRRETV